MAVRHGLERAAQEAGNINLTMADNQLDAEVALGVADQLVASGVDLAIEYQIDEQVGSTVSSKFNDAQIPVDCGRHSYGGVDLLRGRQLPLGPYGGDGPRASGSRGPGAAGSSTFSFSSLKEPPPS